VVSLVPILVATQLLPVSGDELRGLGLAGCRRGVARQARDRVVEGQPLLTLHTEEPAQFERALAAISEHAAFEVSIASATSTPFSWAGIAGQPRG
jgi:thymidine phosphorylase